MRSKWLYKQEIGRSECLGKEFFEDKSLGVVKKNEGSLEPEMVLKL